MLKLRVWRVLLGKRLDEVARDVRLPVYIVSAIERGEVHPTTRWRRRFEEVYGLNVAAELLAPADTSAVIGPATAGMAP